MHYVNSAVDYLKKRFGAVFLGLLLGATLFGGMISDSTLDGFKNLSVIPGLALLLLILDVFGVIFSMLGRLEGPEDDGGIVAFDLGVAVGSGVVVAFVVSPIVGLLWAISLFACTILYIGIVILLLLVLEFSSKDYLTGKRWNWPFRK